jgi:Ca-activated chloride channel family protein
MSRFSADRRWPLCLMLILMLPALSGWEMLRRRSASIEAGNGHMKTGKPEEALTEYDKAIAELPADPGAHFDRGTALAALSRFDEAAQEFLRATEAKDTPLKSQAFYNLGNAFFKKDKFKEAVEAYKRALTLDPHDARAKWNLEIALRKQKDEEKKKKEEQDKNKDKKKDDKKDQNKDKDDKDKKKDQNKDDKKDQDKDKDKQDQQKPKDTPAEKPPAPETADEQEIGAVLDSLERDPKELEKERARLRAVRRRPPAKDW